MQSTEGSSSELSHVRRESVLSVASFITNKFINSGVCYICLFKWNCLEIYVELVSSPSECSPLFYSWAHLPLTLSSDPACMPSDGM